MRTAAGAAFFYMPRGRERWHTFEQCYLVCRCASLSHSCATAVPPVLTPAQGSTSLRAKLLWLRLSATGCHATHTTARQRPHGSPEVQGSNRPLGAQEARVLGCPPPAPELQGPGNDDITHIVLLLWVQPDGVTWPAAKKWV